MADEENSTTKQAAEENTDVEMHDLSDLGPGDEFPTDQSLDEFGKKLDKIFDLEATDEERKAVLESVGFLRTHNSPEEAQAAVIRSAVTGEGLQDLPEYAVESDRCPYPPYDPLSVGDPLPFFESKRQIFTRIGIIHIHRIVMERDFNRVRQVFMNVVPIRAGFDSSMDAFSYFCISSFFDIHEANTPVPTYTVIVSGETIEFLKE